MFTHVELVFDRQRRFLAVTFSSEGLRELGTVAAAHADAPGRLAGLPDSTIESCQLTGPNWSELDQSYPDRGLIAWPSSLIWRSNVYSNLRYGN